MSGSDDGRADERSWLRRNWPWIVVPFLLVAGLAWLLYALDGGGFSGADGYDLR